jgi:hypothetical protein
MDSMFQTLFSQTSSARRTSGVLMLITILGLTTACGSAKVYTPRKSLEFGGSIYNVSDVRQISTRLEAVTSTDEVISLDSYDGKQFDALLLEKGSMTVRSLIALDDNVIVYQQQRVERKRDFNRLQDAIKDAYKKLTRFMADARKTQLKL